MGDVLTLWDIDGTLVNMDKHHINAYQHAIENSFGFRPSKEDVCEGFGLPAKETMALPLRKKGIEEDLIERNLEKLFEDYSSQLRENIGELSMSRIILPGVLAILKRIEKEKIPMGIVTGNIRSAGSAILEGCGLMSFFRDPINSYADGVNERSEIVYNAIKSAKDLGLKFEERSVYVLGDTSSDIKAARENGCTSIGVIKNSFDFYDSYCEEKYLNRKRLFMEAGADYIVDDFIESDKIMKILGR